MLKFHSDMAKQKSLESKSYLKYYAVLDSPQVFRNGFIFENTSTYTHYDTWLKVQTFYVKE